MSITAEQRDLLANYGGTILDAVARQDGGKHWRESMHGGAGGGYWFETGTRTVRCGRYANGRTVTDCEMPWTEVRKVLVELAPRREDARAALTGSPNEWRPLLAEMLSVLVVEQLELFA